MRSFPSLIELFNAKSILLKEQHWYSLTQSWEDMGIHTVPQSIYTKVNVIVCLEFELTYYDPAVQRFAHYTKGTPPIPTKQLSYASNVITIEIYTLLLSVWAGIPVSKDWVDVIFVSFYKAKCCKIECGNYRGISLLKSVGNIFAKLFVSN